MCILFSSLTYGQDSLLLMSGRMISVKIQSMDDDIMKFSFKNKKGKLREGLLTSDEIYSFKKQNEEETIIYVQDIENGYIYTPEEHRFYIHGEQDARSGFKTHWTKIVGFSSAVGVTMWAGSGIKPFIYPVIYSLGMQIPVVKIRASSISDPSFKTHDSYQRGYEKTARAKKFVAAFISSMTGVVVGIAINELRN